MCNTYYLHSDTEISKEVLLQVKNVLGSDRVYADIQGKKYGYYFLEERRWGRSSMSTEKSSEAKV